MIKVDNHKYKAGDKVRVCGRPGLILSTSYTCTNKDQMDIRPSYVIQFVTYTISVTEDMIDGYESDFARPKAQTTDGKIKKLSYGDFCGKNIDWDGAFLSNSKIFTDVLMPKINEIIDKMNERED